MMSNEHHDGSATLCGSNVALKLSLSPSESTKTVAGDGVSTWVIWRSGVA